MCGSHLLGRGYSAAALVYLRTSAATVVSGHGIPLRDSNGANGNRAAPLDTGYNLSNSPGEGTRADPPIVRAGRQDSREDQGNTGGRTEATAAVMEWALRARRVWRVGGGGGWDGSGKGGKGGSGCNVYIPTKT